MFLFSLCLLVFSFVLRAVCVCFVWMLFCVFIVLCLTGFLVWFMCLII